ncbi:MAG: hypothetical protein Q8P05_02275 [Candidatus Diapherotrites archaeon]|nr:hypothetical protein [Candidatus Diapherotrites archaeon]
MSDTATITANVSTKSEQRFRKTVKKFLGESKGVLGKAISEAMDLWVKKKESEEVRRNAIETLNKGFNGGKILYKSRDELYDRD